MGEVSKNTKIIEELKKQYSTLRESEIKNSYMTIAKTKATREQDRTKEQEGR